MNFIGCIITLMVYGQPTTVALTGQLLREYKTQYLVDLSHSAKAVDGLDGEYGNMYVDKEFCINHNVVGVR